MTNTKDVQITFSMSAPRPGFSRERFTPNNWNDPTLNFIRTGLEDNDITMWEGKEVDNIDVGNVNNDKAILYCSRIVTSLGKGLLYGGSCTDQKYALIYIDAKKTWFYVSWYKRRGKTEAVYYANEDNGVFTLGKPVTYTDAIYLGQFLNGIQKRTDVEATVTRIHTHEED